VPYFSAREILIGAAGLIWLSLLFWLFAYSDGHLSEVAVHLVTEIPFAVFVVFLVDYANRRDRESRTKSRQRAVAHSVHMFYQKVVWLFSAMVRDGVLTSVDSSLPTQEAIEAKAKKNHSETRLRADFEDQPIPYAAYFLCEFRGDLDAGVFPPRSVRSWAHQLAGQLEQAYKDVYQIEGGELPDEVVDALAILKDSSLVVMSREILGMRPITIGYWSEDELEDVAMHLNILESYFAPLVGLVVSSNAQFLKDAINNALVEKARKNAKQS
jgi:hypothetical protein